MTKEELDIQKEIEKYFTESTGFGRDKIRNFMDIVNKALKQKGERIAELEQELTVEKDLHQEEINLHLHAEEYIKSLEKENKTLEGCLLAEQEHTQMLEQQIEKMKKYIKACWVEENLNDYSSYITNTSDEFRDLVKELNAEVRNGR